MQRLVSVLVAAFIVLLLWSPNSHAVGVGLSIDASRGSGEAEWDSDFDSWDIDSRGLGFGFVLDTAPTDQSVFNYRLNITLGRHEFEQENGPFEFDSRGVSVENIFGFAFIKREDFRWWAGPLVRVGYYSGDTNSVEIGPGTSMKADIDYGEFGVGAVTGMNFKAGHVVFAPSAGFRFSGYGGEGKRRIRSSFGGTATETEDIEASATTAFANIAVLF